MAAGWGKKQNKTKTKTKQNKNKKQNTKTKQNKTKQKKQKQKQKTKQNKTKHNKKTNKQKNKQTKKQTNKQKHGQEFCLGARNSNEGGGGRWGNRDKNSVWATHSNEGANGGNQGQGFCFPPSYITAGCLSVIRLT